MPNLILVDKRIHRHEDIVTAVNVANNVHCILFDGNMSSDDIRSNIQALNISSFACVGLVQHNNNAPFYQMFGPSSQRSDVLDVASRDASLQSWSETASFLSWLKSTFSVQHFDMMACAIYSNPDWKYVIDKLSEQTGVELRASTDNTGSAKLGGNWFLESHSGVDLKTVYFTDAIDNFQGILVITKMNRSKNMYSVADGMSVSWGNLTQSISGVIAVYSNDTAFAALKTNGSVVTWGSEYNGGNSSTLSPTGSSISSGVVSIYSTNYAFAALKTNGSVVTWGGSNYGGDSDYPNSNGSQLSSGVIAVYSTDTAFAALKSESDGNGNVVTSVVTWGNSNYGGDASGNGVASQLSSEVVSIYSTNYAFAALKTDGSVVTWGSEYNGGDSDYPNSNGSQLSSGVVSIYSTNYAFAALKTNGSVVTWGSPPNGGDASGNGVASQLSSGVVSIYSNSHAFAALKTDGSVVTWGDSNYGGDSDYPNSNGSQLSSGVIAVYSTIYAFAALKTNGSVVTWGDSNYGGDASGNGVASQLSSVVSIYSNSGAFAALKSDGSVVTWGYAYYGGTHSAEVANQLSSVVSIYSTGSAFAAIKTTNTISAALSESYYTDFERYKILSNKETNFKYNADALSGAFTISPQDLKQKLNIKVPATVGLNSVSNFRILVPA
jgi:hypothetical protein